MPKFLRNAGDPPFNMEAQYPHIPGGRGNWETEQADSASFMEQIRVGWFWVATSPAPNGQRYAYLTSHRVEPSAIRLGFWDNAVVKEEALRALRERLVESIADIDRVLMADDLAADRAAVEDAYRLHAQGKCSPGCFACEDGVPKPS